MFIAPYIDETGTHEGAPVMALAGYLATTEKWKAFGDEWEQIIRDLQPWQSRPCLYFHMTRFVGNHTPYGPLRDNPKVKQQFAKRIIDAIKKHRDFGFCVALPSGSYEAVTTEGWRKLFGSPYTFCAQLCLGFVGDWVRKNDRPEDPIKPILYTFARGAEHENECEDFLCLVRDHPEEVQQYHYDDHTFLDAQKTPQLQAADVLACEANRELKRILGHPVGGDRYIDQLVEDEKDQQLLMNEDRLLNILVETLRTRFPEAAREAFGNPRGQK